MAHGQRDFGMYAAKDTVGSMADNAELAARLKSIVTFDRAGDVVWLDDFECGINNWYTAVAGVGAFVRHDAEACRNGGFSMKLNTGDAVNNWAYAYHNIPLPVTSRIGFEISFTCHGSLGDHEFRHLVRDPDWQHDARLRFLPNSSELQYYNTAAGWTTFVNGLVLLSAQWIFHTVKLVIDLSTQRYVRAIVDGNQYDMTAYGYRYTANLLPSEWQCAVQIRTGVIANIHAWFDDAIVTQNEE